MRTLFIIATLTLAACGTHRHTVQATSYYDDRSLPSVFKGDLDNVKEAYIALTESQPPNRHQAAVEWLETKPAQVAEFEALAREYAAAGSEEEAAAAWLLMGHAWLYVAENGRRLPPPAYSDQQGAEVWDDVVARLIDPRFDDLESQALVRLRRAIELAEPRGKVRAAAERTITEIQIRRGTASSVGTAGDW